MRDAPKTLELLRAEIDAHLVAYMEGLPAKLDVAVSANGDLAVELLQEFALRPGKRLRGALAIVGYRMFGGTRHQTALDLALAVELAQDYLLIVDDVMDRSETRRGRPTVHRQYRDMLARGGISDAVEHLGNMLGLNVGLMAQHLSARVLSEIDDKPERVVWAQQLFQKNMVATSFGQLDDLINQTGQSLTTADTRRMYMLKSGYYTFINPLQLGAALAGAAEEQLEPIREFGEYAGFAFQLQDDLLGMFGDEVDTGKASIDDLREGKMTLLMRHALAHADAKQLREVRTALGNEDVTQQQHGRVCTILTELGTREYVMRVAREAAQAGLAVIAAQTSWSEEGRECLSELVGYAVLRGN